MGFPSSLPVAENPPNLFGIATTPPGANQGALNIVRNIFVISRLECLNMKLVVKMESRKMRQVIHIPLFLKYHSVHV